MPLYESVFIVRQDVTAAQVDALGDGFAKIVEENGGAVDRREYWGLRTLSYRIKKNRKGHYGYLDMDADNAVLDAIDFKQKYADDVMRHMTVKVDELTEEPSAILRKGDDRKRRERR